MNAVEVAIRKEDWKSARKLIGVALRRNPQSHWLHSRLALTYCEQKEYEKALKWDEAAFSLAPNCPLVLWGLAGARAMVGRFGEAEEIYRKLIRRGARRIAFGVCGEGLPRAKSLVTDCWYRVGLLRRSQNDLTGAARCIRRYIARRRQGSGSIYSIRSANAVLRQLAVARCATGGSVHPNS